jgi:hypothetical protein
MPTKHKARTRLQKAVDPLLVHDPACQELPQPCRTTIELGLAFWAAALQPNVPLRVLLVDRWDLAEARVSRARSWHKAWISLRKKHRNLETTSCVLKETAGTPLPLEGPHRAGEDLVPRIPPTASRAVPGGDTTSWPFPRAVRLPGLGKVRLVVSGKHAELTGTSAVLGSKRVDWQAPRILPLEVQRWPMETL